MSNILPAGREGRAPSSSTTHAAPAILPAAGEIRDSRDDGTPGEHACTGAAAEDGESKGGANPPGGATRCRTCQSQPPKPGCVTCIRCLFAAGGRYERRQLERQCQCGAALLDSRTKCSACFERDAARLRERRQAKSRP